MSKSKNSPSKSDAELEQLDLAEVVREYGRDYVVNDWDETLQKCVDLTNPVINWDFLHITHEDTKYEERSDFAEPTANVLFTATYINDTPEDQTYTLRTERKTKSMSTMNFKRVYTFGSSLTLSATPPSTAIGAAVGFKRDIQKERGVTSTTETEFGWSVDNEIKVPKEHQTKAELIVIENLYSGEFTIKCIFEGKIMISYYDTKTKEHKKTITVSPKVCFKERKEFTEDNQGRPVFIVHGKCNFKYGIEQNLSLTEGEIPPDKTIKNKAANGSQ